MDTIQKLSTNFKRNLKPGQVYTDLLRRIAWGGDASFYQKWPQIVVQSENESEVVQVLHGCHLSGVPVTFRAAGTSLCGQSLSDSVLLVAGQDWSDFEILDDGERIRVQPGLVGGRINQLLSPLGWKLGPDPATINSAMIGGIVANNASGMNCGTRLNSYRLIESARIVFADGAILDTASAESRAHFMSLYPDIVEGIENLRDEIRKDINIVDRIRRKYRIKNVTGYGMNSFLDFDDPVDIILHLMVGSEGTLGFLSEITLKNVIKSTHSASAMVYFQTMCDACEAIVDLRQHAFDETEAAELLDNYALKVLAASRYDTPDFLDSIDSDVTVVLFETNAGSEEEINTNMEKLTGIVERHGLSRSVKFTSDPSEIVEMWAMRKAVFPLAGSMRPVGTSCIIEDVAFPMEVLPEATIALQQLALKHGYKDAVIYGHALEGNYHIIFSQDFGSQEEVSRFERFIDSLVELVAEEYDGSLKAEHGTGFGMAAFVKKEWGSDIYKMMVRIKSLLDPSGILNPGVIINNDPACHVRNLKPMPIVDPLVDLCIECGFCEQYCVSYGLTLSARQRISLARIMTTMRNTGRSPEILKALEKSFKYYSMDTCAADGLCQLGCPVGVDTGKYIKQLRAKYAGGLQKVVASLTAEKFAGIEKAVRMLLTLTDLIRTVLGDGFLGAVTRGMRKLKLPVPQWTSGMARKGKRLPELKTDGSLKAVYFPTCLNRMLSPSPKDDQRSLPETVKSLFKKADIEMISGEKPQGLCCGQPWESYGHNQQADMKSLELSQWLLKVSGQGAIPILVETTACLERMRRACDSRLQLYGPEEFALEFLVDRLDISKLEAKIAVHSTCTTRKIGIDGQLIDLAKLCATNVVVPEKVGCCGMAGNRGLNYPELNQHGLRHLKSETKDKGCTHGYSVSATCEIGLTTHSGIPYKNILALLDKVAVGKMR